MPLITTAIPNLIGGVSQQPPAIRNINDAEVIDNAVPNPVEGLTKRPPTEHIARLTSAVFTATETPFIQLIERDQSEKYILVITNDGTVYVTDLAGTSKTLHTETGVNFTLGSVTSPSQRKVTTIGDVSFITNATTTVAMTADTVAQSPANYNRAAMVWIKQTGTDRVSKVSLTTGGTTTTFSHSSASGSVGTEHAATQLATGTNQINSNALYGASAVDSTIYITADTNADFSINVEDDYGGEGVVAIRDQVSRFEDLPPTAVHGWMVKVIGSIESGIDDYWVKFKADNGSFSRGIWEECAAPGLKYKLNAATMPALLIRQSDGSFMLKYANGTTPTGSPVGSDYSSYKWQDRLVGDEDTNPTPSFVGNTINDMVYYQHRLGFLAGENVVFSETSEFFNFWRNTVLDLLDTDSIDVASSTPRVNKIFAAVPFNRDLILFTPTSQMVLRSGDILSPKSIALISAADFENQASLVAPIPSANSIFFTYPNGNYVGMRELIPQPALDGAYYANDLTDNVSSYIPGPPTCLTATTHENIAVIIASGNMYCYRYLIQGNERVQHSWFRFTFNDSNPNANAYAKPIWAGFLDSDMYVVFLRTWSTVSNQAYLTLEKIRMGANINDSATSGKNWLTYLDQRKYYAAGSGTYNSATNLTTFTLHLPMRYAQGKTVVVTADGYQATITGGTQPATPNTAATLTILGDYSAKAVWIGTSYSMLYEFSTPYLRGAAGKGQASMLTGRYQLRYLTIQYANSAYFRALVGIKNEGSYEYVYTGETVGTSLVGNTNIGSGSFRIPIHSKNDNLTIKLINDSPLPSRFLSCEIEAFYNNRATRTA